MQNKKGFTLVEISLATAFLSALLLTIALLLNALPKLYQKGVTIQAVNYSGQELIDEFTASLSSATDTDLSKKCDTITDATKKGDCSTDGARKFLIQTFYTNSVSIKRQDFESTNDFSVPMGGVLCTGYYTYLWNSGYVLDDSGDYYTNKNGTKFSAADRVAYKTSATSTSSNSDFRLIRVLDKERKVCSERINAVGYNNVDSYDTSSPIVLPNEESTNDDKFLELLQSSEQDGNLALYDLNMFLPTRSVANGHVFYSGSFILATISGAVNIKSAGNFCAPPGEEDVSGAFLYCAINKFNFAVRATGGIKL